ncbi:hypothetical protein, conserved [Plasmodium vivax]|uniref:Uncharacterized protein n=1 Tax=Plasmodium vivax TaxID=5855 RepID=A0A1G4E7L0_PLAVI|nr:hypothetical protein, conserved [Plasmodium vivax]
MLNQDLYLVYLVEWVFYFYFLSILQLDPSLEEEEDDSVKFLELLEDFHQEISEIFRNMVVGMLDIVKWICLFRGNSSCCVISS